jgi:hypothetical protein
MTWKEPALPALRELESTVLRAWSTNDALNDYTVGRAYEGAYQLYRARLRGREPKPPTLNGLDLEMFNAVRGVCEKLLTSGATPLEGMPNGNTKPLPLEKLVEYLRELARSVERHTKHGGPHGYLTFVRSFFP